MARPSSTADTMVEKLSSASTMSEAVFATAVPEPMAMPISAFFKAGASFTPSPVCVVVESGALVSLGGRTMDLTMEHATTTTTVSTATTVKQQQPQPCNNMNNTTQTKETQPKTTTSEKTPQNPTIAVISPSACRNSTILDLWAGSTLAKRRACLTAACCWLCDRSSNCLPVNDLPSKFSDSPNTPILRHIASAVSCGGSGDGVGWMGWIVEW